MSFVGNVLRDAPEILSQKEQKQILEASGEHINGFRDFVIISVALGTFLRESEIAALNVGDVGQAAAKGDALIKTKIQLLKFKRPPTRKKKNGAPATSSAAASSRHQRVFVPKSVRRKLVKFFSWKRKRKEPLEPGAPLFLSRRGDRLSTRMMRQMFHDWQRLAGFEMIHGFHVLRHTGISNLYRKTRDLHLTRMQARHTSINTTQIYTHLTEDELERAIEGLEA